MYGRKSFMNERVLDFLNSDDTKRKFMSISGLYRYFQKTSMVGYCHCETHKGVLDITDMNRHNCIEKCCHHFEKYEQYPYWQKKKRSEEAIAIKKAAIRAKQLKAQEMADEQNRRLEMMRTKAQTISRGLGFDIVIMKIEKISPKAFALFYVSDSPFNDWYIYQELSVSLYHTYSKFFELRHIKTIDGRYAVLDDIPDRARYECEV